MIVFAFRGVAAFFTLVFFMIFGVPILGAIFIAEVVKAVRESAAEMRAEGRPVVQAGSTLRPSKPFNPRGGRSFRTQRPYSS